MSTPSRERNLACICGSLYLRSRLTAFRRLKLRLRLTVAWCPPPAPPTWSSGAGSAALTASGSRCRVGVFQPPGGRPLREADVDVGGARGPAVGEHGGGRGPLGGVPRRRRSRSGGLAGELRPPCLARTRAGRVCAAPAAPPRARRRLACDRVDDVIAPGPARTGTAAVGAHRAAQEPSVAGDGRLLAAGHDGRDRGVLDDRDLQAVREVGGDLRSLTTGYGSTPSAAGRFEVQGRHVARGAPDAR